MIKGIHNVDPARFNRICKVVALLFLFGTVGGKLVRYHYANRPNAEDWPQYYMGAIIAHDRAWDALYPIPTNPKFKNPGDAADSALRPRAAELARARGVDVNERRYMQPPPFALALYPLAWLDYWPAQVAWTAMLCLAAWGIALQAGEFYALCARKHTRAVGWIILLVAISPQAFRWGRSGNLSAIIGWLIGLAALDLARGRDGVRPALPLVLGAVAKYVLVILAPLHVVTRRWRTLAWTAAFGAAWLIVSLLVMGVGPYKTFLYEIAPTLKHTTLPERNLSLHAFLIRTAGMSADAPVPNQPWETIFRVTMILTLLAILALIFTRPRDFWRTPAHVFAAALALLAWSTVFSPIMWEHYHAFFAPFWGWLIWEGARRRTRLPAAIAIIALAWMPMILVPRIHLPEPLFSHLLWSVVLMMLFGMWVMWKDSRPARGTADIP